MKLLQREVVENIGVDETSIHNWETNLRQPHLEYMPAIIEFLGYNPLPEEKTIGEQLMRHRTGLGMTQEAAARHIGVDPSTLARWERGEREPLDKFMERINRFLTETETHTSARTA